MAKDKKIFVLGFCSSSKTSSTDLACSCAPYFTYAEDIDWAKFNLGAVQGTLTQPAGRGPVIQMDTLGTAQALISNLVN